MQFREEMLHCYLVGGTQDVNHDPKRFLNDVSIAMDSGITAFQYREKWHQPTQPRTARTAGIETAQTCRSAPYSADR